MRRCAHLRGSEMKPGSSCRSVEGLMTCQSDADEASRPARSDTCSMKENHRLVDRIPKHWSYCGVSLSVYTMHVRASYQDCAFSCCPHEGTCKPPSLPCLHNWRSNC
jgi:hypothetical protein